MKLIEPDFADYRLLRMNLRDLKYLFFSVKLNTYFIQTIFFFLGCVSVVSQTTEITSNAISDNLSDLDRPTNLNCVPPSALSYSSNAAFYCTGIPIAPNIMSYVGSTHTSILISPDLPLGLSLNMSTGTITGTPISPVAGNLLLLSTMDVEER